MEEEKFELENEQTKDEDVREMRIEKKSNPLTAENSTGHKYVKMIDEAVNATGAREKSKLMMRVQRYVVENDYIIQKFIENMEVKDKVKVVAKLKKLKEQEIKTKMENQKNYNMSILIFAIILLIATSLIGIYQKDQTIIIIMIIIIGMVSGFLVTIEDYIYDTKTSEKELKSISSWLEGLKEEESVVRENRIMKEQLQDYIYENDVIKKENKELLQRTKEMEAEIEDLKVIIKNQKKL